MGQLLYDKASLVNIPSRYKDGKLYNIKPSNADFEFERGTQATRVNKDGLIEYIGIGEELINYDAFYYGSGGFSLVGNKWFFDDVTNGHLNILVNEQLSVVVGETYEVVVDVSISSGNAGFRLTSGNSQTILFNYRDFPDGVTKFTTTVTGIDGLIQRLTAPTSVNDGAFTLNSISVKKISNDTPRIDYTDSNNPSLLLEPARTNLVEDSWDTNTWTWGRDANPNNTTRDFGYSAPDGSNNATLFTRNAGTTGWFAWGNITTGVNADFTYSVFVKKGTSDTIELFNVSTSPQSKVVYNFNTNTFTTELNATGKSVSYSDGWYRISMTYANGTTASSQIRHNLEDGESVYVFGAQAEQGSYATSYIPTNGGTETRNAEECTGGGDADTFNDSEGVLFVEFSAFEDTTNRTILFEDENADNRIFIRIGGNGFLYFFVDVGGTQIIASNWSGFEQTDNNKVAVRYSSSGYSVYVNGIERLAGANSISFTSNMNEIKMITFPSRIKSINYFPEALEDHELERLTSPTPFESSFEDLANNNGYTIL